MQKKVDPMIVPNQPANKILPVRLIRRPLTKKRRVIIGVVLAVLVLAIAGGCWYRMSNSAAGYINGNEYQAIFTTNNQAYFGKLQRLTDGSYRLTNVYYLHQAANTAQKPDSGSETPQLVKMGSELHGPEDEIIFDKNQVLFWENLKTDSKVAKAINDYLKK